jgi:hypothetical protein
VRKIVQLFLPLAIAILALLVSLVRIGLAAPDAQQPTKFDGDVRITRDLTVDRDVTVDDVFNIDDTSTTISGTQTITPSSTFLVVAPTVASTITLATGNASAGDWLIVVNTVTTNTNIVDTGATQGGGAIDLGLDDLAIFLFGNGKWIELASPDNS